MATRGYKVPLSEGGKDVPGYLIGFTGEDFEKLKQLKSEFGLDEEQDVVRLAIRFMEKMTDPKPTVTLKKTSNLLRKALDSYEPK